MRFSAYTRQPIPPYVAPGNCGVISLLALLQFSPPIGFVSIKLNKFELRWSSDRTPLLRSLKAVSPCSRRELWVLQVLCAQLGLNVSDAWAAPKARVCVSGGILGAQKQPNQAC